MSQNRHYYSSNIGRIDPELKAQWVAALLSGDYTQGRGELKTRTGEFCCLGVYCDMTGVPFFQNIRDTRRDKIFTTNDIVTSYGTDLTGLSSDVLIPATFGPRFIDGIRVKFTGQEIVFSTAVPNGEDVRYSLPLLNDDVFTFAQIADVINYFL